MPWYEFEANDIYVAQCAQNESVGLKLSSMNEEGNGRYSLAFGVESLVNRSRRMHIQFLGSS